MKDICRYIKENLFKTKFKGMNVLYHSTGIMGIQNILKSDFLIGETWNIRLPNNSKLLSDVNKNLFDAERLELLNKKMKYKIEGISLTRDWFLNYNGSVTLILDKDKLKQKYGRKLQPIDYFGNNNNYKELDGFVDFEFEFTKHLGKANPNRPYSSVESEEFLNIPKLVNLHKYILGFIFIFNEYNLKQSDMIEKVSNYCSKYKLNNIPIYDFEGNLIKEIIL